LPESTAENASCASSTVRLRPSLRERPRIRMNLRKLMQQGPRASGGPR
jgi:hypothetical protein